MESLGSFGKSSQKFFSLIAKLKPARNLWFLFEASVKDLNIPGDAVIPTCELIAIQVKRKVRWASQEQAKEQQQIARDWMFSSESEERFRTTNTVCFLKVQLISFSFYQQNCAISGIVNEEDKENQK